ncbi:Hsp20 family protein [Blautia sp.]
MHAKYENGILHVTFPKEETKKEAEEKKFVSID